MVDTFSTGVPISSGYAPDAPRFGTVIEANLNRTFDPIISSAERKFKFGSKQDPKYDFKKYAVGQYAEFSAEFASQPNDQAAVNLRQQIDRSSANRQTLAMATTAQLLGSAFFDPINYIGLPFGGPALTVGRAALRVGASVGAVETVREGAILATDPLGRYDEAALNVGSSILFGAAIGGLVSAPAVGRAQAFERVSNFVNEYTTLQRANENAANISPEMFMSRISRDQRPFAAMDDAALQSDLLARVGEADDLRARAGDDEGLQDLRDRAAEIERGSGELRQELGLRYIEDSGFRIDDPYGIPANWFTDSVFYKAITNPMKRALQSKYPTIVKEKFFNLGHDMSLAINKNSLGIRSNPSVFLETAVSHGQMAKMEFELKNLYGQVQQNPMAFDDWIASASRKRLLGDPNMSEAELKASSVLEDYFGRDVTGRLEENGLISTARGQENRIRIINEEIEGLTTRRVDASERELSIIDSRVRTLEKDRDMIVRMARGEYDGDVPRIERPTEPFFPRFYNLDKIRQNKEAFTNIIMDEFRRNPHVYEFDPVSGDYVRKTLSTDPAMLRERADRTVNNILSESDPVGSGDVVAGLGRSKHFRHRKLDIPTAAIIDYIELNPVSVLNSYNARVNPRTLFQQKFGKDYFGVATEMELDMIRAGASEADINKMRVDFDSLYRRIVSNVLDRPDAMNQKIAYGLRSMATFAFMGGAGITSLGDFGRIVMQYELAPLMKGVKSSIDMDTLRMSAMETRMAGSALDYILGMYRLESQISNNFVAPKLLNSAQQGFYILNGLTPLTIAYKRLSGLVMGHTIMDSSIRFADGTISDFDKMLLLKHGIDEELAIRLAKTPWERNKEGMILPNTEQWADHIEIPEIQGNRVTVIEAMEDGTPVGRTSANGTYAAAFYNRETNTINFDRAYIEGPMFERQAWLNPRLEGVDALPDIFKTPKQWSNFVMLHEINHSRFSAEDLGIDPVNVAAYENRINQLALADFKAAKTISDDLVTRFRVALNSGITNTVIHGTPADRPIITDGVVHIPMSVASKFGLQEDKFLKGYARVENGFLAMPFQFYNFLFGSMNKTLGAMAHNQVKNRAVGAATMLGLSYMILKMKTNETTFDNMSYQDKMARTIDASGLLPFYSDLFYRTMHSTIALGGPNITGGVIQPKFKQRENPLDVVTDIAGAGPSWAANVAEGIFKVTTGDYGEGASDILRMMPMANMWFLKGEVSELAQAMRQ
jgi:hypothetical protein